MLSMVTIFEACSKLWIKQMMGVDNYMIDTGASEYGLTHAGEPSVCAAVCSGVEVIELGHLLLMCSK